MTILSRRRLLAGATAGVGTAILNPAAPTTSAATRSDIPDAAPLDPVHMLTLSSADFHPVDFNPAGGISWSQHPDGLLRGNIAGFLTFHAPLHLPVGATVKRITWHTNANPGVALDFIRYRPATQNTTSIVATATSGPTAIAAHAVTPDHTIEAGASYVLKAGGFFGTAGIYGATVEYVLPPAGYIPLTPFRAYDSRWIGAGGPLAANASRTVSIKDAHDTNTGAMTTPDLVPVGAQAVTYNLTITATAGIGFLAITPAGAASFAASAINWSGPNQDLANGGTVPVSASREVTVWGGFTGSTQFIIDVTGYYN